jgi:hypothetical protein
VLYIAKREVQVRRQNRSPVSVLYVCWLKRGENSVVPNVCLPRDTRGAAQGDLLFSSIPPRDQVAKTHYECQEPQEYCQQPSEHTVKILSAGIKHVLPKLEHVGLG